ncbi:MAG: hypothetical protein LBT95_03735 [Treponema sp.]|nr:hypothetical protein [Treponema sp.]
MIIALVIFWYGLVPVAGAFANRHNWRVFRACFDNLRLRPLLDYAIYSREEGGEGNYRFTGGVESVTDGHTLWVRGENLTVPIALAGAHTYVLSMPETGAPEVFDPGEKAPERVRWDRVSALTEGAKVFVGGSLVLRENRRIFVSTREQPLLVIFYDGPDRFLTPRTIRAGRSRNEYWNVLTPYAFILGSFSQLIIAFSFLSRPAFLLTVITAFTALFVPLFPLIPPGILCTVVYRYLWGRARLLRAYRDLVRLPLKYFLPGTNTCRLPGGEFYGAFSYAPLSEKIREGEIPFLIPREEGKKKEGWYIYGALSEGVTAFGNGEKEGRAAQILPREPRDVFAPFGIIPGNPERLIRRYTRQAYILGIISWVILLIGLTMNIFFVALIVYLLSYPR